LGESFEPVLPKNFRCYLRCRSVVVLWEFKTFCLVSTGDGPTDLKFPQSSKSWQGNENAGKPQVRAEECRYLGNMTSSSLADVPKLLLQRCVPKLATLRIVRPNQLSSCHRGRTSWTWIGGLSFPGKKEPSETSFALAQPPPLRNSTPESPCGYHVFHTKNGGTCLDSKRRVAF
jgi:hypothetical protein